LDGVFEFFFKYRPLLFERGSLGFGWPGPPLLIGAMALLLVLAALQLYVRRAAGLSQRDRTLMVSIRLAAVALLALALARPMLLVSSAVPQRNIVALVVDDSKSMRIPDQDAQPRSRLALHLLGGPDSSLFKALAQRFQLRFFKTSGGASQSTLLPLTVEGGSSELAAALLRASDELAGAPVAGMILISDGADNSAERDGSAPLMDQLLALRARNVPVYTIGVGSERFRKDIEVSRVEAPREALRGATLLLKVVLQQAGYAGLRVPVTVEDSGRIVASREVTLPPDARPYVTALRVPALEKGARLLRISVPVQDGELISENNERRLAVAVRDRREKVLYIEGEPRFELKFIRRAVEPDSNLQVVTLLRSAKDKFLRLSVDDSLELAAGFPRSREELFAYRAIILGSIEASFFTADQLRMIADFVSIRGGGLLVLGGRRALAEGGYAGTALADVLPVELDAPLGDEMLEEVKALPTAAGGAHPAIQLAATDTASTALWQRLPALTVVNRLGRLKPGATMLLEGSAAGGRRLPLLIVQRFGAGQVALFGTQDSWLWQMHASVSVEDQTHETFWRQLLRWLLSEVPDRLSAPAVVEASPGEAIALRAVVRDSSFLAVNAASVSGQVRGEVVPLGFEWSGDRDGVFLGSFVPETAGLYEVSITAKLGKEELRAQPAFVHVAPPVREFFGAEMRPTLLRRIAEETGGKFYPASEAVKVAQDIVYTKSGATVVERYDLWDMPVIFILLVALLGTEWLLRRRKGLV
jgi:uncharacterized membrane protein